MGKSLLSCRDVLWLMVFCGFGVNYMLRTNLNLAIVAMVVPRGKAVVTTQCGKADYTSIASWRNVSSTNDSSSILSVTSRTFHKKSADQVQYDWNEYEQAVLLGAYYWIHWITQLPGGLLARRYGTKFVFGWANFATALVGMLIPLFTRYHLYALMSLRALQGFISGVAWPSMHDMTAKWIPQNERGKFVSAYLGSSVGAAITYPLCALCIDWYGWEAAFYSTSLLGVICITMPKKCYVQGCTSGVTQTFKFPQASIDRTLFLTWLTACGNNTLLKVPPHNLRNRTLCIHHFEPKYSLSKKLSSAAIPTLCLPGKSLLSCRDVLWLMVFCGFGVNYMLRTNLNLAIVAMVVPRGKAVVTTQCGKADYTSIASWRNVSSTNDSSSILSVTSRTFHKKSADQVQYDWNEYEQAVLLGAYYWIHWITQLPGGLLARRYGTKFVFGWANFATALVGMLIPLFTRYHLYALMSLRALQGFISGVAWPSMHDMTAKWIPQNERGKFVSAYLGSSVGAAITYPLCALCIDWYGWEAAFYSTSLLGVIWYVFWYFLVFDTPQGHPRISDTERKYLAENLGSITTDEAPVHVPWKKILTSGPLWVTTIAHWGGVWGFLTFMTEAPTYLTYVHGWNINATGILSGLPHLLRMIFSYFFGIMTDWLLRTNKMTLTNVRKLATFVCTAVQGIMTLGLAYSGCEPLLAIFFIMAGTAVNGSVSAGTLANLVDLSPNYASVLLGFAGLISASAGFISPTIVGILTNYNQTIEQWRLVFLIAAANLGVSFVVYMIWGTSDEQPWNSEGSSTEPSVEELRKLRLKSQEKGENDNSNTDNGKNASVDSTA